MLNHLSRQKYEIELNVLTLMFFCARVQMTYVRFTYTINGEGCAIKYKYTKF